MTEVGEVGKAEIMRSSKFITSCCCSVAQSQEMFNKDIEETKKSKLKMNNAINVIKNNLEGTMSRIRETEDRINEVEDKMVEINEAEKKNIKKESK